MHLYACARPSQAKGAEKAAMGVQNKMNLQTAPIRTYLDSTVVPVLLQGLSALVKERCATPTPTRAHSRLLAPLALRSRSELACRSIRQPVLTCTHAISSCTGRPTRPSSWPRSSCSTTRRSSSEPCL